MISRYLSFILAASLLVSATLTASVSSPETADRPQADSCSLPEPSLVANRINIFSDQQEQWLGEVMAASQEREYTLLPAKDSEELTRIGQKLLAQLPPTPVPYHFRVYDSASEDLNGLSLAGGYIYVSRKLLVDAKSEDEAAGVLAHEIGHIYTHQIATEITRRLAKLMNVSTVGDHADIQDKYLRLLNVPTKQASELDEKDRERDELRADAVGLYAMVRAGYAPAAFATTLERITDSKGRNGNFLSDILGGTTEAGLRVRTARSTVNSAPEVCKQRQTSSSPAFATFQQWLIAHPVNSLEEATPGLSSIKLDSPIRPGLNRVRFSPDGKYVLAQNDTYIYVLSTQPLKVLFQIYAPLASTAHFTPDSQRLVFHYQSLRVEEWNPATGQRTAAHELVEYKGCQQSELSPDGRMLACVLRVREAWNLSVELFDVASGKIVFTKNDTFTSDSRAQTYKVMSRPDWDPEVLAIAFSPDAKYLVVAGQTNNFAMDLTSLKPVAMRLGLGGMLQGRMTFTSPTQLMYDCAAGDRQLFRSTVSKVCMVEFPGGAMVKQFPEGWESLSSVTEGNYALAGTIFDSFPHLVDLGTGNPFAVLKFAAADVRGKLMSSESGKGGVTLGEIGAPKLEAIDLPETPLPYVRAAQFSPDGRYLALSNENRGAIWDLAANKQMVLTRSFRGAWFDGAGQLYLQVAASQGKPGQNLRFDLKTGGAAEIGKYDFEQRQRLDVSIERTLNDINLSKTSNVGLQAFDIKTGAPVWQKKFSKDAPRVRQEEPGSLVLACGMEGETAWDETAHSHPVMSSDAAQDRHQGMLTEVVDSHSGAVTAQLITPQIASERYDVNGRIVVVADAEVRSSAVFGNLVAVQGNQNDTTIYNLKTGARMAAFWGVAIAGDAKLGLIAATNRDQELVVYDTATGAERVHATLSHRIVAAQFVEEKKQLLVLTADQRVDTFDLPGGGAVEKAAN